MPKPNEIKDLYYKGDFEQVAALWADPKEADQFSDWDHLYCMNSMYKLQRYPDCLEVYRACSKKYPNFHKLDDKMGWALYHTKVKNFDFKKGDTATLLKQIDYVFKHSIDNEYSPRWRLAKYVADAAKNGDLAGETNARLAISYLDQIDPAMLSAEEQKMTEARNGKERKLASKREDWYSYKTALLLKLKQYDECIACCDEALESLAGLRLHYNNDSWFRYRKAKCLQALNRPEQAKVYVTQILQSGFSHWCLLQLMYEFEMNAGNIDKALSYAGACALSDSQHDKRVSFYDELADDLERNGDVQLPMLLRKLVLLLRSANDWKAEAYRSKWQLSEEIDAMDMDAVLQQLQPVWCEWRDKDKVYHQGKIDYFFQGGRAGLILAENGKKHYFAIRDIRDKKHTPAIGMNVRFTLEDRLDKKKGIISQNAVEITIL